LLLLTLETVIMPFACKNAIYANSILQLFCMVVNNKFQVFSHKMLWKILELAADEMGTLGHSVTRNSVV
jgi:hypothetical protein